MVMARSIMTAIGTMTPISSSIVVSKSKYRTPSAFRDAM